MVVEIARRVDDAIVEIETPSVAAIGVGCVCVEKSQADPHRVGSAGNTMAVGVGEDKDLPGGHAQAAVIGGAAGAVQRQRLKKPPARAVDAVG